MKTVLTLENGDLKFDLFEDCSADVVDKRSGKRWHQGPVAWQDKGEIADDVVWTRRERYWADYFVGRFRATKMDGGVRVELFEPPWREPRAAFVARYALEGRTMVVRVESIDEGLPSLNFPTPLDAASIVMPADVGRWIREDGPAMTCEFASPNNGLNMRWVGGLAEDERTGWMIIFEDGYADSGLYRSNKAVMPCWLKSKGSWGATRSVRYVFTENGYVGMAKAFRRHALERGIFRRLEEKIAETPAVGNLLGGRIVSMFQCSTRHVRNTENFYGSVSAGERARDGEVEVRITHADAAKIAAMARRWGMTRGVFNVRGTFRGGYDESHPDIWPPEPKLGSIEDLRKVIAQEGPYLVVLHDNYQDMYDRTESFPQGVVRRADGGLLTGGPWHGGLCYITCPKVQGIYARRNWEHLKTLGLRGTFVDTAACVQFYQCYDPGHPMTRGEDAPAKLAMMKFYRDQGLVVGSEEAADFGMLHLDFLENRHRHTPRLTPPIWPLVFHDAAFFARYSTGGTGGGAPARQLENYLWGYMCYWPANDLASWPAQEQAFRDSLALDAFHARVGMAEMTNHRYLDDGMVEQSEFSTGVSVIANFAAETRKVEGRVIPPFGHVVID